MVYKLVMPVARRLCLLAVLLLAAAYPAAAHAAGLSATKRVLKTQMAPEPAAGAYVIDLETGRQLFARHPDVPRTPASVNKLFTTSTALQRFGPRARLTTDVLTGVAPDERGVVRGNLFLRGGGDPSFDTAAARSLRPRAGAHRPHAGHRPGRRRRDGVRHAPRRPLDRLPRRTTGSGR